MWSRIYGSITEIDLNFEERDGDPERGASKYALDPLNPSQRLLGSITFLTFAGLGSDVLVHPKYDPRHERHMQQLSLDVVTEIVKFKVDPERRQQCKTME